MFVSNLSCCLESGQSSVGDFMRPPVPPYPDKPEPLPYVITQLFKFPAHKRRTSAESYFGRVIIKAGHVGRPQSNPRFVAL